jgi:uncharacterized protein (TIGR02453 family)
MHYFEPQFLDFFKELAANNRKNWFDENRKTYETYVKNPFLLFIQDLIDALRKKGIEISPEAKNAIFRINRDIRFSKDKTPYKLFASALISATGKKNNSIHGFYVEFNPEKIAVFAGMYMPDKDQIFKIRTYIAQNLEQFSTIIHDPKFVQQYGTIQGENQVRIAKEFKEYVAVQPLLIKKQWYIEAYLTPENILEEQFLFKILEMFEVAMPLHLFMKKALD